MFFFLFLFSFFSLDNCVSNSCFQFQSALTIQPGSRTVFLERIGANPGLKLNPDFSCCRFESVFCGYYFVELNISQNCRTKTITRIPHWKVTKLTQKFTLILEQLKSCFEQLDPGVESIPIIQCINSPIPQKQNDVHKDNNDTFVV